MTEVIAQLLYDTVKKSSGSSSGKLSALIGFNVAGNFHSSSCSGTYEASIVVFDRAYSYGENGIKKSDPIRTPQCKEMKLGKTQKTEQQIDEFFKKMGRTDWKSENYNSSSNNGRDFVKKMATDLKVSSEGLPEFLNSEG